MSLLGKVFSGKPSQREFAEMVTRAFEKAGIGGLEYREAEFALKVPGKDRTVFLHNSYTNYCSASRKERPAIVARLVASLTAIPEIPSNFAAAKASLMPVVRDAAYYGLNELLSRSRNAKRDPDFECPSKPLAPGLDVSLAYDGEQTITSVNRKQLKEWGAGFDEAFAAAKDSLREKTDPNCWDGHEGVYRAAWGDSYDSSRMLLTELIYRLSVDGDPVAHVPNRDAFWVTGKGNPAGLSAVLKAGAESHFKQGHPISPDLYVLVDGNWSLYVPEDRALRELWLSSRRQRNAIDYQQQKKLLDELHAQQGIDVFVASYKVYEGGGGAVYSGCVWSNVPSSLPKADKIAFVVSVEDKDMFAVPWDAAWAVVRDLLEEEAGLVPVRYRTREFPGAEQIERLRKLAG